MEIWKQYKNTTYYVSSHGRVFSEHKKEKFGCGILKKWNDGHGYCSVSISGKKTKIHILVAETFIPNPENKPQVNHKDCDTKNNYENNLEWSTPKENMEHAAKMKVVRNQFSANDEVAQYDLNGNFLKKFSSPLDAAKSIGEKDSRGINDVCRLKQKTHRKFIWRYVKTNVIEKITGFKKTESSLKRKVGKYDINGNLIEIFNSITDAAFFTGNKRTNISNVLIGKQKTSRGFSWKYINV